MRRQGISRHEERSAGWQVQCYLEIFWTILRRRASISFWGVLMCLEVRTRLKAEAAGPIILGSGTVIHLKGSKSFQVVLSRIGVCVSYDEVEIDTD